MPNICAVIQKNSGEGVSKHVRKNAAEACAAACTPNDGLNGRLWQGSPVASEEQWTPAPTRQVLP
jgi:hypothetical protein